MKRQSKNPNKLNMPPMSLEEAACKIQSMYRVRMARRRLRELLKAVVERFYDEDSGLYYYYNSKTGQSSWSKPTLLGSEEANLSAMYNVETNAEGDETIVEQLEDAMKEPQVDESNESADPSEKKDNNNGLCEQKERSHMSAIDATPGQDTPAALEATETSNSEREAKEYSPPVEEHSKREKNESDSQQTTSFTPDELLLIEQQFKKFDKDGSGSITAEEMVVIMQAFGDTSTLETIKELIQEVDKDGNGEVNLDEFIHILQKQREKDSHCPSIQLAMLFGPDEILNLRKQFESLDTDGSGEIDEGELAVLMKALGQKVTSAQLKEIIREVDRNGNGMIDFNEFCHIVYNMRNAKQTKFAALLHMGIAKGLLNDLGNVMAATKTRVISWWNAEKIAEEKRLQAKRERALELQRLKREQEERERKIYEEEQARLAALEKERWTPVEGLYHEVLFEGEQYPNKGQYARVHYTAMFENGKVFEASRTRGGAFEFKVGAGHVIQGWDIAIQRMSIGETAKITCAPKLAYGVRGRPPKIPPNTTLVFKVELIAIHEKVKMDQSIESDDE
ncbi:hypothetical protein AeNC1_001672 [Aphanomyces euteiches]|nr:hypothetical protein AeNC1_001672 [Aphanomyces euteiches]